MRRSPLALLSLLLALAPEARADPGHRPGWIGASLADDYDAVVVRGVARRGPAARAGLKEGDRIAAIDGAPVRRGAELSALISRAGAGHPIRLRIADRGVLRVVTEPRPPAPELLRAHLIGHPAPAFRFKDARGGPPITNASVRGDPAVLEFYATWCRPCDRARAEMREAARQGTRASLIAISAEPKKSVLRAATLEPAEIRLALDAEEAAHHRFLVTEYPVTIVLDERGIVRKVITGADRPGLLRETLAALSPRAPRDRPGYGAPAQIEAAPLGRKSVESKPSKHDERSRR